MATAELTECVKAAVARARAKLAAARHLLAGEFWPDAVPSAYYAAGHMAEADLPVVDTVEDFLQTQGLATRESI